MERHRPALSLVADLDLHTKEIAELPLQCHKVGIHSLDGVARTCPGNIDARARLDLFQARALLRLSNRKAPRDDFASELLGVVRSRHGSRVAHADIAFQ